jgi:hypothetical protein
MRHQQDWPRWAQISFVVAAIAVLVGLLANRMLANRDVMESFAVNPSYRTSDMKVPIEFKPIGGRSGWHRTSTDDPQTLEARALELHGQFETPVQIVCGSLESDDGYVLYLIENASATELAREFATGSHNDFEGSQPKRVYDELSRVFKIAPFRPYFIDDAGYKAKFLDPLTQEQAHAIESVLTVGLEGYVSEWSGDGPLMVDTLLKENGLRLWWD